jgi:uncharacterized membrane protein (DUF106 family)
MSRIGDIDPWAHREHALNQMNRFQKRLESAAKRGDSRKVNRLRAAIETEHRVAQAVERAMTMIETEGWDAT